MLLVSVSGEILRQLPSIDQVLQREDLQGLISAHSRALVLEEVQEYLAELRRAVLDAQLDGSLLMSRMEALPTEIRRRLESRLALSLRKVINASGIILHTNIGRAPLSAAAAARTAEIACSYSNLEYDLREGKRGHRDLHFEERARRLLDCESATVCNNNAAALFLILNTLAAGKKVLVSRGELIEIGGSFRIPDILERSGARLKEVGTTNRTRLSDYRLALDEDVSLILRVHPSNYKITGFTARPELGHLVSLAREKGIPLVEDVGSGYLFPAHCEALAREPTVENALQTGVDLVCFSGDKLLGGPQAGIILGKKALVDALRKNPLMRAFRVDKGTYAALEETLLEYERGTYLTGLPVYRMLLANREQVRARAEAFCGLIDSNACHFEIVEGESLVGGGAAPEEKIPTALVAILPYRISVADLERRLRANEPAVLARIEGDRLLLDLRTVFPNDEAALARAVNRAAAGHNESAT
jgi:L-seryl-tRNA(Ser) seleniumtransferase